MRHKSLIETDLKILRLLAEEKEYCQYDMPDSLQTSYRTVMRRLFELENMGLVRVTRRERSTKRGKKRKIYALTFKGAVMHLASISLEPIKLIVLGGETHEEVVRRIREDIERYREEARSLIAFLEFYGKQLDYPIFKEVRWLVERFPMKTEAPILRYILQVAKLTKAYFMASEAPSAFTKSLRREKSQLRKLERQIEKYPSLGKISMVETFGKSGKEKKIEIDIFTETKNRLENAEKDLERALELENEAWKLWFAERFFERISHFPAKGNTRNEPLHKFVSIILERKKSREIASLEKIVNLFG